MVENQQAAQRGQGCGVERCLYRQIENAGQLADQRPGTDPAHHAAREQGKAVRAPLSIDPLTDQDWPQGVKRSPTKAEDQTTHHQPAACARHQGKTQARRH
ncbi:hypothetical protein D3C80_1055140 [compost metagenome]